MTSSTSNSDLVWSRKGGAALLKSIAPFAAIFIACNLILPLWAVSVGERYVDCNNSLTGAEILRKREKLIQGDYPRDYDIIFAGTSRTMGGVNSKTISGALGAALKPGRPLKVYNMGVIGRCVTQFNDTLTGDKEPGLLVFEFHPLVFMKDLSLTEKPGMYQNYRIYSEALELSLAGQIKKLFGLPNIVKAGPLSFSGFIQTYLKHTKSPKDFYYYHLARSGHCWVSEEDNQATYHHFLNGASQGKHLRAWYSAAAVHSQLDGYSIDPKAWGAFERIVKRFGPQKRLAVARMPFDLENYALENKYEADVISKTKKLLEKYNVPYIDMNPNTKYFTSDTSHLDWYASKPMSEDLANRLLAEIRRGRLTVGKLTR